MTSREPITVARDVARGAVCVVLAAGLDGLPAWGVHWAPLVVASAVLKTAAWAFFAVYLVGRLRHRDRKGDT